jgi:predicted DNA-binding protein
MSVTIWVTPEEQARLLQLAQGAGTTLGHIVRQFMAQNPMITVPGQLAPPDQNKSLSMRLPEEDVEWLDNLARFRGESRSEILRSILRNIEAVEPLAIKVANTNKQGNYNVA